MRSPKRIVISGYYGFSNAGDEAVLASIVSGIRSVQENTEITVLSAAPEETSRLYGVKSLPRYSMSEVRQAIRECDLLISGGGSLIQDATSIRSLVYYLGIIWLAQRCHRRVMVLGQGIGPLRRRSSRCLAGRILKGVDLITVRDAPSAGLLGELGIDRSKIAVTADPTFALQPCPVDEAVALLGSAGIASDEDVIAVSLREWADTPEIEETAVEALRSLAEKLPAKILLLAMHMPDDMELAQRVRARVPALAIQPDQWTPPQILGVLAKSRMVIAMRLHALIFAASMGVPSVGISYDPKVESFLSAIRQECIPLGGLTPDILVDRVLDAWTRREDLSSRISETIPEMRQAAEQNFAKLSELLKR